MTRLLLILFCLGSFTNSYAQPTSRQQRIKAVENNLMPYVPVKDFKGWNLVDRMNHYHVPGLSIAVIKDYKIDWAKGYGWADTTKHIPVTVSTMFSAGSVSKFLMAATALKLADEGLINIDSPVNKYLSSWKLGENEFTRQVPVTMKMLLSHTGGTSQSSYFGFTPGKHPLPSVVEIVNGDKTAETRRVVVNRLPGKEFQYSGGGSMVAQLALMDVSGKSFEKLTEDIIFSKLGMRNSTFEQPVPEKYKSQCAWAYSEASWFKGMPYVYPQQAAAGLYSTPSDLAAFFIDIQQSLNSKGKVLSQSAANLMMQPQANVSDGGYKEQIGTGPFLLQRTDNTDSNGTYFEFTGVNAGFLAYGIASIRGGNGVIIMMNSGDNQNGIGKEIRRAVAKVYGWKNYLPEEVVPVQLSNKKLNCMVGRYRMGPNEVLYLRKEKNYLVENINEGDDIYCFPVANDTIVFTDFNVKGFFKFDQKGNVVSLQSVWQNQPMPKMKENEFSPGEYLRDKKYAEAKKAFTELHWNEYQLTYLAYELMNRKPAALEAAKTILEVAELQHPGSSIIYSRWGDYYLKLNDRINAIKSYTKAVDLDPTDEQTKQTLQELLK